MNRLTEALERAEPTMAVVITEPLSDEILDDIVGVADVAEFRADKFPNQDPVFLTQQIGRLAALPTLLTIRIQPEGGSWAGTEEERLRLFSDLLPFADGVDVELENTYTTPILTDRVHSRDKVVIASSHNFEHTPTTESLESTRAKAAKVGADYTKVAASAKTREEYERLLDFTVNHKNDRVIVVAMDDYGPLSRIALPGMGSHLTYASVGGETVAPGQMNYIETAGLLKKLYPEYEKLKH